MKDFKEFINESPANDPIDKLIKSYNATGKKALRNSNGTIKLDGKDLPEEDALKKILDYFDDLQMSLSKDFPNKW
jgi:hypothetical protein